MAELTIRHTSVFTKNYEALVNPNIRFIVNQGGTRSSKTYSICQMLIVYALNNNKKTISIIRKTLPALKATVMKDFFEILNELNLYDEKNHNKSDNIFKFPNGSCVEFFSLDNPQKVRGRKRHIAWINEANELLTTDEFNQINFRCDEKMFFDFNPSDTDHWLYDVMLRPDALMIHSTYKNNSFLPKSLVKEIEELILVDQDYYNIYALGLPSKSTQTIFNHHKTYDVVPSTAASTLLLGLDFGHVHPTALVICNFDENNNSVFVEELLYESYLTTNQLIERLDNIFELNNISKDATIVCDYARPEIIAELNSSGFNCVNAIKNVVEGIDAVKSIKLFINNKSLNLKRELSKYKWKQIGDRIMDEPVKQWDDLCDAMRYSILYNKRNMDSISISFVSFS